MSGKTILNYLFCALCIVLGLVQTHIVLNVPGAAHPGNYLIIAVAAAGAVAFFIRAGKPA